jgi:Flp pilus assembly protein TadG
VKEHESPAWRRFSTFSEVHRRERGAAAVEMALVLPSLLFILFALVDFGRAFNTQIQLSQAAREGVRLVAMQSPSNIASVSSRLLRR